MPLPRCCNPSEGTAAGRLSEFISSEDASPVSRPISSCQKQYKHVSQNAVPTSDASVKLAEGLSQHNSDEKHAEAGGTRVRGFMKVKVSKTGEQQVSDNGV
jgi:hypothetical protein